ncbi:MAG: 5'-nucleotidase C-terminal domain-containing protein [Sulfurimonas sp.]|nr:5'-nucleotidase C-terminal domain-containing protein [Sulfurimonas sp.]
MKGVVTAVFAAFFCLSGCAFHANQKAEISYPFLLSVVHVNDTHSHLESETILLNINGIATKAEIGGYPRMATKIKELQASKANTLTLNAGDTFQGTPYYSLFKGKADSDMLNMISWDALELGNHEFDDGDVALAAFLNDLNIKNILAANIEARSGSVLSGKFKPYFIKEFNGEKVGVVGIDTKQKTKASSNPSSAITFYDEVATAQKYIDELKTYGVNKIVLLSHVGLRNDKAYAAQLSGVDIIIGGDSHSLMGDFSVVGLQSHEKSYPFQTQDRDGKKVCIGHAWQYGYAIGAMDVAFDANGVVTDCSGAATLLLGETFTQKDTQGQDVPIKSATQNEIVSLLNRLPQTAIVKKDEETKRKLANYKERFDEQKRIVIGKADEFIGHTRIPETTDGKKILARGSDIVPLVAKSFYELSNRADACIQNGGGVRTSVDEGDVTIATAYTLLPFSNTLFEIDMYGSEIKQVLEDALSNYLDNGGSGGSFPYAYGLRYDVNTQAKQNNRILNLEIKNRANGEWERVGANKMYVIVTNSYIAAGKDGYTTFKRVQDERGVGVDTYLDYALSFVRYVEKLTREGKKLEKLPSEEHCVKSYNHPRFLK